MNLIVHSKPFLDDSDYTSILNVLKTNMIANGTQVKKFENLLSMWFGIENGGVAVASGSAAIFLALKALNVKCGDEVILPTYLCNSVLEAILSVKAIPVFCDVSDNWVVTPENMENYISTKTKALIVPHIYGIFADVASFRKFGIPIIEDCAQAIDYKGKRKIIGDIAVFSFHPTKCLTTGEGGMAISNDLNLVFNMLSLRDGSVNNKSERLFSPMSDINASLGLNQLNRFHEFLDRRKFIFKQYTDILSKIIPECLKYNAYERSMAYRFPLIIDGGLNKFKDYFARKGICVKKGVDMLLHRMYFNNDSKFEMSVTLFNKTLSLPIYPAMTDQEISHCIQSSVEIFSQYYRNN